MGYTTDFTGDFRCYTDGGDALVGQLLRAILHGDHSAMPPLADHLIGKNDPRGETVAKLAKPDERFRRLFGLKPDHAAYLRKFNNTRRMKRDPKKAAKLADPTREAVGLPLGPEACYFVGGGGMAGQDHDISILAYNQPPKGQPGLWCKWKPNEDGSAIVWDGAEKFYDYVDWLKYLLDHFLKPWGYVLNGDMAWQGEDEDDVGTIYLRENVVTVG